MNHKTFWLFLSILSLAVFSTACDKVPINPNDSSPPTVEFKIKGADGQYAAVPAEKNVSVSEGVNLSCVADDPQGIKSVAVTFSPHNSSSCTVGSSVYNGSFSIDGVPANQEQDLQGDSQGKVPTRVPLLPIMGPFSCNVPGQGAGAPYGTEITVICKGENWSSNSAVSKTEKTMKIKLH